MDFVIAMFTFVIMITILIVMLTRQKYFYLVLGR